MDVAALADELEVVEDVTGSEEYKRHVATVFAHRAIEEFARRAA
jgi:CO/xanthine dehydrogenase FAD-binding subunit